MEITLTPQWLPLHVVVLEKCKFKVRDWLATGSFDLSESVFWQNKSRNNSQWVNITPSACLTTSDGLLIGTSKNVIPPAGASWPFPDRSTICRGNPWIRQGFAAELCSHANSDWGMSQWQKGLPKLFSEETACGVLTVKLCGWTSSISQNWWKVHI